MGFLVYSLIAKEPQPSLMMAHRHTREGEIADSVLGNGRGSVPRVAHRSSVPARRHRHLPAHQGTESRAAPGPAQRYSTPSGARLAQSRGSGQHRPQGTCRKYNPANQPESGVVGTRSGTGGQDLWDTVRCSVLTEQNSNPAAIAVLAAEPPREPGRYDEVLGRKLGDR